MKAANCDLFNREMQIKCFLCEHVFSETEEPWHIFHKQVRADEFVEFSIAEKLSKILEQEVKEQTAHSSLLCDICHSNLLEYESLERRLLVLRENIIQNYNSTVVSNKIEGYDNTVKYIELNDGNNYECIAFQNTQNSHQILQFNDIIEEICLDNLPVEFKRDTNLEFAVPADHTDTQGVDKCIQNAAEQAEDIESIPNASNESAQCTEYIEYIGDAYRCKLCQGPFDNLKLMVNHLNEKHNKNIFYCEQCQTMFTCHNLFNLHMKQQHTCNKESATYECLPCELKFINYRDFCRHRRLEHDNSNQNYECKECKKSFRSQNILNAHMNAHRNERNYKCYKCVKVFDSKNALQVHAALHTERKRVFQCNKCEKTFSNKQNLVNHEKLHVDIKAFKCDECEKSFKLQSNLDIHKKMHEGFLPFQCGTCGKDFGRRGDLRDHERTHTGEKPFQCDLCPMAFSQVSNLSSHKKYTHFKESLHKCTHCDRSFKRRRLLEYHIKAAHTGERPHKCSVCGMGFIYPEHFKKHMRKHTGQTPYACEVCGKLFKSSDNRNTHRFVHSEKKPYECLKCGAGFMRKPQLLMHMSNAGHMADTIIVNQPQIALPTGTGANFVAAEYHVGQQTESLTEEKTAESISNEEVDAIVVDETMLNENLDVQYLKFEDVDNERQSTIAWVDIEDT